MAAHNSSQFLYQDCLIAELSIDTQLQLLNIGKYVFRPLSFFLALLSFVLNTLVIIALPRTKSLQYPAMVMMCSLGVTDAILPLYILHRYIEVFTYERRMCSNVHPRPVQSATSALCIQATLGNLTVISKDRYLAVRSPWWYRNHVTKSRAFKVVCIPWCIRVWLVQLRSSCQELLGRLQTFDTNFNSSSFRDLRTDHNVLLSSHLFWKNC